MATTKRGKPPLRDAREHAAKAVDKTAKLEVKFISSIKGRGVFATDHFQKGDFVVEYRGELISFSEAEKRRTTYDDRCAVFLFDFYWQEKWWCIDAAIEDGSLGRLVNDDDKNPNCKMKIIVDGEPHLCLFAVRDISPGEEVTYDYGGTDWPWRTKGEQSAAISCVETQDCGTSEHQVPPRSSLSKKKICCTDSASDASSSEEDQVSGPKLRTTQCLQVIIV
ncbi:N-lysine methyltransferase KMT5A-A-like [Astyanax mexicanus]|uniref:N-lysine methyltransferase KMT5A-A-like n=1 Tax=Astyanax mexicanus TaxID=7994 RepID=UPI0020CABE6F|nr:N-lysine methyltransferase KMT5A-A-like [Astyanax mexicanus]